MQVQKMYLANFRHCEIAGIPSWKGVAVRTLIEV